MARPVSYTHLHPIYAETPKDNSERSDMQKRLDPILRKHKVDIYACGHILVIDYFSPRVDGVKLACIQFFICGVLSVICMLIFESSTTLTAVLSAWKPLLYAGALSCGVAYTLQIIGQRNMNPTVASLLLSMESCISVIAGWLILGQALTLSLIHI